MDTSKLSFFDFISIFIIGYLIVVPFVAIKETAIDYTLLFTLAYITGLVYHKIIDVVCAKIGLRNCSCMIKKAYGNVVRSFPNSNTICNKVYSNINCIYHKRYYLLMTNGALNNIPILEAQATFTRNLLPILVLYLIGANCQCCKINTLLTSLFGDNFQCAFILCSISVLVLIPFIWYSIQMKIHELVWEGGFFISEIDQKEKC